MNKISDKNRQRIDGAFLPHKGVHNVSIKLMWGENYEQVENVEGLSSDSALHSAEPGRTRTDRLFKNDILV